MNDKSRISVIIVSLKVRDYLSICLDAIRKQGYDDLEVIVIDNSQDKEFGQGLLSKYPEVKFLRQERNLSYSQALNLGIEESKADYILCLNDDVVLGEGFIRKAIKGFFIEAKVGMVSGKILRQDKMTIDSTGLFLSNFRTAKERGYGRKDRGQYEKAGFVFGISGAVAFYRREMLDEIKEAGEYFDTCFGYFYEDLDIAWRAQRRSWKAYYIPEAIAFHLRGGTARLKVGINKPFARRFLSDDLSFDLLKNRYLTLIKNESILDFLLHFPAIIIYECLQWSYILVFRIQIFRKLFRDYKYLRQIFHKSIIFRRRIDIHRFSPDRKKS
jgi:GT2 family glycosyltransferase